MIDEIAARIDELEADVRHLESRLRWARRYNLAMLAGVILGLVLVGGAMRSGRVDVRFAEIRADRLAVGDVAIDGSALSIGSGLVLTSAADGPSVELAQTGARVQLGITGSLPHLYLDGTGGRAALTVAGHPELRLRDNARHHVARIEASAIGALADLVSGTDDRVQVGVATGGPPGMRIDRVGAEPVALDIDGLTVPRPPAPPRLPEPAGPTDSPSSP